MHLKNYLFLSLLLATFLGTCVSAQTYDITLNTSGAVRMNITEPVPGTYDITTTGNDSWVPANPYLDGVPFDPEVVYMITFEYSATAGLDLFEIFYGQVNPARKATWTGLYPTAAGEFRTFKAFMKFEVDNWNSPFAQLRFDISNMTGVEITMRNIQLRAPTAAEVIPLTLNPNEINAAATTVTADGNGGYDIVTSGADPWIASEVITQAYDPTEVYTLTYDYMGSDDLDDFRVFFQDPWTPARMAEFGPLAASPAGQRFTGLMPLGDMDWLTEPASNKLRFDFGRQPGKTINVSNFILREPTHEESKQVVPPVVLETVCIELNVNQVSPNGQLQATETGTDPIEYTLTTVGPDPWIRTKTVTDAYDTDVSYIIEFEYKASDTYNELQIFYGPPINGSMTLFTDEIPAATDWTTYTVNPRLLTDNFQDGDWTDFRIDFGRNEDPVTEKTFQLRNLKIRKPTAQELIDEQNSDKFLSRAINEDFLTYLAAGFTDSVKSVVVDETMVTISGRATSGGTVRLAEVQPQEYGFNNDGTYEFSTPLTPDANGEFSVTLPRYVARNGGMADRLYARWAVVESGSMELMSYLAWPTDICEIAQNNLEEDKAETIKGLDGLTNGTLSNFQDLNDLDVKSMKINLVLNGIFSLDNNGGNSHTVNGKTYGINQAFVDGLDARIKACFDNDIKVAFVLLVPLGITNPQLQEIFLHPDARLGLFSMANVTSAIGVEHYTALIDFLAERYSRPDGLYGRVDQWIIHNEVDAHISWTHAGEKPQPLYTQIYDRSMRLVHYTLRKHNPTAKVFASFTKHWNSKPGTDQNFKSVDILETLTELSFLENDYEWGIGWHSYPTNLRDPRVWLDNPAQTQLNFATPQITPRNLEMIDAYVRQERLLYNGKKVRTVLLSENGFSSNTDTNPLYTQQNQAAALAYFWKKTNQRLPSIENIQYHRWVDNPNEGGLEFGLWTVQPGTVEGFNTKKESWFVWEAAGTPQEDAVFDQYKSVVGVSDWEEINNAVATETTPWPVNMTVSCLPPGSDVVVRFNGEKKFPQNDGSLRFFNVASDVMQPYYVLVDGEVVAADTLMIDGPKSFTINLCALPVEWLAFTATARDKDVLLNWETTTDQDNAGFIVQRSANGGTWTDLREVDANNSARTQQYELTDASPLTGTSFYRIVQNDFDGENTISPVRKVNFAGREDALSVTPNPSNGVVHLGFPTGFIAGELQLIDATGRVTRLTLPASSGRLRLDKMPKGAYLLRAISVDGNAVSGKLILR